MGKQNRERRAAKQRKRQRAARGPQPSAGAWYDSTQAIGLTLVAAAAATAAGVTSAARDCAQELLAPSSPLSAPRVQHAAVTVLADRVLETWRGGWQPIDLHQIARRRLTKDHVGLLVDVLAEAMSPYAAATVDPRWLAQLSDTGAERWWPAGTTPLAAWAQRAGKAPVEGMTVALELLALLLTLHPVPQLLPLPGTVCPGAGGNGGRPVDERMLARVRALLAKAESTEFPEEAEALSAKAQELMTRHSLERLVVESAAQEREPASARRLWLDAPYANAKALLVDVVAQANRCSAVWTEQLGFMTVLGDERDLIATELMVTSLLVQATRAMVEGGRQSVTRQRSYRQSFLIAYAHRIGERLQGATAAATAEVVTADLLPVLAADSERLERAREEMFPSVVPRSLRVSSSLGWAAGRAAADRASLHTSPAISEQARAAS